MRTKIRVGLVTLAVVITTAAASGSAHAATYYVAPGGANANLGTSGSPWATLQYAADHVAAGDTVIVHAGTYVGFDMRTTGTAALPIAFLADPGTVIGTRNAVTPDGINVEEASYIVIDGFTINGMPRAGIRSAVNDHVTIRHNTADGNGHWGIFSGFSDDLLIENNVTSHSQIEHGIYVSNSGDRPVIRGNLVFGNHANGIHMNGDISQGGDGIISGALVERNTIWGNGVAGGSGINCDGVQSSRFQNNLLYDNHASGISLYQIDAGAPSMNNIVVNNTILEASDARWAINIQDGSTGNFVSNNILYDANPNHGSISISTDSLSGFVSNHNVVMDRFTLDGGDSILSLAQWKSATSQDAASVISAPASLFVDAAGNDYRLRDGSPAIDAGSATNAPATDLNGYPRPLLAAFDIGALERARFLDVPPSNPFWLSVEKIARDGVTAGCGGGNYCLSNPVTRAQMSVFILKSAHGAAYTPPPAAGTVFTDVPANGFAAAYIEELHAEGITSGCGGNNFCPGDSVTRAQMAVFLLRGEHGPAYNPPPATGAVFTDVSAGSFAAAWIERLSAEGITGGCGGTNFCPSSSVTRGQMAAFLSVTFALP